MWKEEKCQKCGKTFIPTHEWVYKEKCKYYCSWTCYNHRADKTITKSANKKFKRCKRVEQYTLDGKFIAAFENADCAAKVNKCKAEGIRQVCRGDIKKYKGFVWQYSE